MSIPTRFIKPDDADAVREASRDLPSWGLSARQAGDVEFILNGAFFPLTGFMTSAEVNSVGERSLWRGHFFPVPILLDVNSGFADQIPVGQDIALRDQEGVCLALLKLVEKFPVEKIGLHRAGADPNHICLAGDIRGVDVPEHHDFKHIRLSPEEVRTQFRQRGWHKVLGFATRRLLHRKQVHETTAAANSTGAKLLIAPAQDMDDTADMEHYVMGHCFEHALKQFPPQMAALGLLPLAHRHSGIGEALLHALVLRNYDCSHYLVDEMFTEGTGLDYNSLQEVLSSHDDSLGIKLVANNPMVYCAKRGGFTPRREVDDQTEVQEYSRKKLQQCLTSGLEVPEWYTYPDILGELRKIHKPRPEQGFTLFFTGLSGAGKSTVAKEVLVRMMETGGRNVTLLDGDIVRQNLSSELGFSREHRNLNIRRIGYVASEITRHGGIAICAPIAPYRESRRSVRSMIENVGGFIEVYVATSIEECERRDRKGLYARARAGIIKDFTGISDPYEKPENPELIVDTEGRTPEESAREVLLTLETLGYLT